MSTKPKPTTTPSEMAARRQDDARRSTEFFEAGPDGVSDVRLHAMLDSPEVDEAARDEVRQRLRAGGMDESSIARLWGSAAPSGGAKGRGAEVAAPPVRYIKLGPKGQWAKRSIETGEIHFGHRNVPHDLAERRDRDALVAFNIERGKSAGKAADLARELYDFYTLGPETIWITVYDGLLWWTHAEAEVVSCEPGLDQGARFRRTIGGWRIFLIRSSVTRPFCRLLIATELATHPAAGAPPTTARNGMKEDYGKTPLQRPASKPNYRRSLPT